MERNLKESDKCYEMRPTDIETARGKERGGWLGGSRRGGAICALLRPCSGGVFVGSDARIKALRPFLILPTLSPGVGSPHVNSGSFSHQCFFFVVVFFALHCIAESTCFFFPSLSLPPT